MVKWRTVELNTGVLWGNLIEREHLENICVDARIILKMFIFKIWDGGHDWIDVA
jgi:hypothetical protein